MYYQEASNEEDDESGYSNQIEENDTTCSFSYESGADWEDESNDGSEHSSEGEGMNSFSESKKESASQFLHYTN